MKAIAAIDANNPDTIGNVVNVIDLAENALRTGDLYTYSQIVEVSFVIPTSFYYQIDGRPLTISDLPAFAEYSEYLSELHREFMEMDELDRLGIVSGNYQSSYQDRLKDILTERNVGRLYDRIENDLKQRFANIVFSNDDGSINHELVRRAHIGEMHNYKHGDLKTGKYLHLLPESERPFFKYYLQLPREYMPIMAANQDKFTKLVVDGTESPELVKAFAKENMNIFLTVFSSKSRVVSLFGEERAQRFMAALPQKTDERRNAFTHNDYDRTSSFLHSLHYSSYQSDFKFLEDFDIVTSYVEQYGLARSPVLFRYYKHISNHVSDPEYVLPEDIAESGIKTLEGLNESINNVNKLVYSTQDITAEQLKALNRFELELMKIATGKSTHRFDAGRPSFDTIVQDFIRDSESGNIETLNTAVYQPRDFSIREAVVEFEAVRVADDFYALSTDIIDAIEQSAVYEDVKSELLNLMRKKEQVIQKVIEESLEDRRQGMEKQLIQLQASLNAVESAKSQDELLLAILGANFGRSEQSMSKEMTRKLLLRKIFSVHYSPGFIEDIRMKMQASEISPSAILSIINIIDELGKQHAFNVQGEDAPTYWSDESLTKLRKIKKVKNSLLGAFEPYAQKLREAIDDFKSLQGENEQRIIAIPDRGFTGEMAAYLADVCYSKEYPLLKKYPNVIPYKFIIPGSDGKTESLIGSVLLFEVQDNEGNDCLLVRGFDIPNESEMNIGEFIEQFLDHIHEIARNTGKKHVLMPGDIGALSNYMMTINHFIKRYRFADRRSGLNKPFDFNGYNLTDNVYRIRSVEDEDIDGEKS